MYKEQEEESVRAIGQKMMERFFEITAQMNEHGVTILAGSDMGPINDYTIDVLHQELVMLVDAGLSNLDALKTATLNPAIFMEIDDQYGSIEINKKADLLILHSNPLEDISNTKDIAFVLKEGKIINSHKMETNNN
jgi:imidazolonepropionase-like amidohydrolase